MEERLLLSGAATAMPLAMPMALVSRAISVSNTTPEEPHTSIPGQVFSWVGAMAYFYARIPQLIKNYRRKSTDGLSPLLFVCTLLANVTYTLSIFTSCSFLTSDDKHEFVMNALPFIVGSAGTIVFDFTYFYQHYVLYADDNIIRRLESDEYMPLIS
ncbi:putative vacuolar amino acid transporter YPQ2 [Kluyveromyces marxianus]